MLSVLLDQLLVNPNDLELHIELSGCLTMFEEYNVCYSDLEKYLVCVPRLLECTSEPECLLYLLRGVANFMQDVKRLAVVLMRSGGFGTLKRILQENVGYCDIAEECFRIMRVFCDELPHVVWENGGIELFLGFVEFFPVEIQVTAWSCVALLCGNIMDIDDVIPWIGKMSQALEMDEKVYEKALVSLKRTFRYICYYDEDGEDESDVDVDVDVFELVNDELAERLATAVLHKTHGKELMKIMQKFIAKDARVIKVLRRRKMFQCLGEIIEVGETKIRKEAIKLLMKLIPLKNEEIKFVHFERFERSLESEAEMKDEEINYCLLPLIKNILEDENEVCEYSVGCIVLLTDLLKSCHVDNLFNSKKCFLIVQCFDLINLMISDSATKVKLQKQGLIESLKKIETEDESEILPTKLEEDLKNKSNGYDNSVQGWICFQADLLTRILRQDNKEEEKLFVMKEAIKNSNLSFINLKEITLFEFEKIGIVEMLIEKMNGKDFKVFELINMQDLINLIQLGIEKEEDFNVSLKDPQTQKQIIQMMMNPLMVKIINKSENSKEVTISVEPLATFETITRHLYRYGHSSNNLEYFYKGVKLNNEMTLFQAICSKKFNFAAFKKRIEIFFFFF